MAICLLKNEIRRFVMLLLAGLLAGQALANNMAVTNVAFFDLDTANSNAWLQFDLSWDNSWRINDGGVTNWDAAWVFIKYEDASGDWRHAYLSTSDSDHASSDDSKINVGTSSGGALGVGAFVYRDDCGSGSVNFTDLRLCWDYSDTGLDLQLGSNQQFTVHAIEMVYVPEGSFYLGDSSAYWTLHRTNGVASALIGPTGVVVKTSSGDYDDLQLRGAGILLDGDDGIDTNGITAVDNADFPTGYKSFYCMKYEISQGQYADFLNQLTSAVVGQRNNSSSSSRHTIGGSHPNFSASAPDRASGYLSWADCAAYADWTGLRPMTEPEFEKACRGPLLPVANEFAWGASSIHNSDITVSGAENGTETNTTDVSSGATMYDNKVVNGGDGGTGPVRCGLFATASSDRLSSGATYWGIMEMTGNVWEKLVTLGNETGRGFTGLHGDGELGANASANVPEWPHADGLGTGVRGGEWAKSASHLCTSARNYAGSHVGHRDYGHGFRAVRSAPAQSGVGSGGGTSPINAVMFYGGSYDGYNGLIENTIVSALARGMLISIK